ncbi:hypothetical protein LCGC14_0354730 [marine sediment metagenome]|uniref:MT-A70 family protein n=1 Tax=marine sediment metagenome TaxID=412755 RepID=A0A0F9WHP6_9ZZZZ
MTSHPKTQLVRYEAARQALQAARDVDEVKDIRDKAVAMQSYAKQAKDPKMEMWAAEIRLRAEVRAGAMLAEMDKAPGKRTDLVPKKDQVDDRPTLADIGISKKESSQWQRAASVPEEEREAAIEEGYEKGKAATAEQLAAKATRSTVSKKKKDANAALEETNPTLPVPDRKYHCIVIDPPWPMKKIDRDVRQNQADFDYPTMDEAELVKMDIPAADDCHLFLWTTHKFLPMALRLLDKWKFKYVCAFVWHKPGGFQPVGLPQYNCEFALYARKGAPEFVETKDFFCCFNAPRREHSRKPDAFYETVRRVCDSPRLDMFSREARTGFDQFGNETDKFPEAP